MMAAGFDAFVVLFHQSRAEQADDCVAACYAADQAGAQRERNRR
jgi:hypothetical protein